MVSPTRTGESYLKSIYSRSGLLVPSVLQSFESEVEIWCDEHVSEYPSASLLEIKLETAVYWFDRTDERVVISYGISSKPRSHAISPGCEDFPMSASGESRHGIPGVSG